MRDVKTDKAVDLGRWIGRRQAFALVAGRCSAADAECIRRMRTEKTYLTLERSWERFCQQHLGISRAWADRIIGYLEEFGATYFMLAQATGITPEQYRRIQGSVRGQALLHAGEEIPIEAENAGRLAAAVAELRRGQKAENGDAAEQAGTQSEDLNRVLDKLDRTLAAAVNETRRVQGLRLDVPQIERLQGIVLAQLRRMPMVQLMQIVVRP
jgi:hypothetical protein